MNKQSGINDIPEELLTVHKTRAVATDLLRLRKKVVRTWLSLLAVFAAGAVCFLVYSRAHMESRAVAHAGNTVKLLQHDLKADIEVVETALRRVAAEYSHLKEGGKSSAGEVTDYLKLQSDSLANFVEDFRVVNGNGVITYGHTLGGQLNIAATGLFQSVKNSTGSKLYFSRVTTEGTNGKRIMYVAQRLTGKQGAFAGAICVGITMDRLTKELSEADIGRSGTIMLRDTDMRYLTRFPPPPAENSMGAVALSPQLLKALLGGESRGSVRQLCPIDHIWKLMSFAEVKPYPFFIEVGLSERDVLSSWYSEILFVCLGFVAMVLISGFVVRRIINDESIRLAAYYDARRSSDNFRDFFDAINRMVIVVDNQGIIVSVNKHALEKLGYGEGELKGTVFELLLVEFCALKSLHAVEMRVRCKDDRTFPVGIFRRAGVWDDTECEFIVMEDHSALNATTTLAERLLGNTSQGIYGTYHRSSHLVSGRFGTHFSKNLL